MPKQRTQSQPSDPLLSRKALRSWRSSGNKHPISPNPKSTLIIRVSTMIQTWILYTSEHRTPCIERIVLMLSQRANTFSAWVRFCSLFEALHEEIIVKKSIGEVQRLSIDFGNKFDLSSLPDNHRLKDPALGGGALLDIGFYTLTFASIILGDWKVGKDHPKPTKVLSSLDIVDGIDAANTVVLEYPSANGGVKTGVCTSSFRYRGADEFGYIQGTNGSITLFGPAVSVPGGFRVTEGERPGPPAADTRTTRVFNVERHEGTLGFYWEADAVAQDIAAGQTESDVVPLDETLRLMQLMDEIRAANGLKYPQDEN
ncbi:hypothetical protein LB505_012864 [Fusarium chuoi]|nr:hypothetical protein LB505_012864 [Fusarium chuoi]